MASPLKGPPCLHRVSQSRPQARRAVPCCAAPARPAAGNHASAGNHAGASAEHSAGAAGAPLVVYLRDAASGEFDVFAGTSRATIVDPDLAARLTRAVR
jgi:hypothetical protein